MKRKGFTLVELLAVIAILAILVIIALPNIMGMFNQAKKSAFETEAKKLYRGAEEKFVNDSINKSGTKIYSKIKSGCSSELDMSMRDELEYFIEVDSVGNIIKFYVKDNSFQYKHDGKMTINDIKDAEDVSTTSDKITITCEMASSENGNPNPDVPTQYIAKFISGEELNIRMKTLSGNTNPAKDTKDTKITAIKRSMNEPSEENKQSINIVSTSDSTSPIYMWYQDGTIYYYSEIKPRLNSDSSYIFSYLTKLTDLSGLSDFDTSNVNNFISAFYHDISLSGNNVLEPLRNWDTSNVTLMNGMFASLGTDPMKISSLKPLSNWVTSNVTNMQSMFQENIGLLSLEGLENWDTSNVTNMTSMFGASYYNLFQIKDLKPLKNWNTSNVKYMNNMFQNNGGLTTLEGLEDWDTSNVETIAYMFQRNDNLTSLKGLENWDTSNIKDMQELFHFCTSIKNADAIKNWNVSNVENMNYMFSASSSGQNNTGKDYSELSELDLSLWDMSKVKSYKFFIRGHINVTSEFTIRNKNVSNFENMFYKDSTNSGKITVNYTSETESLVDQMIETKSSTSNVVKGRLIN